MKHTFPAIAIGIAGLSGCSVLTPPAARPIIEDHAQKQINAFAIVPSRRMLIVKSNINRHGDLVGQDKLTKNGLLADNATVLCAEASPDVADDIASTIAAAVSASGPQRGDTKAAEAGASIAHALAITSQSLFKRTQALQFYRDIAYHLCQAKVNGFLKDEEFKLALKDAQTESANLILQEMKFLYLAQILSEAQKQALRETMKQTISIADGQITVKTRDSETTIPMAAATSAPTTAQNTSAAAPKKE